MHQAHGLLLAPATWSGNPRDRQAPIRARQPARPLSHRLGHRIAHGPVGLKQRLGDPENLLLDAIGIGNHPTQKHVGRPRDGRQGST